MGLDNLVSMQKELMESIPNGVFINPKYNDLFYSLMKVFTLEAKLLNSTGFKSWRPVPLSEVKQQEIKEDLGKALIQYNLDHVRMRSPQESDSHVSLVVRTDLAVPVMGMIEESVEFFNALQEKDEEHAFEELVDIFFFFLEALILFGKSFAQVEERYKTKWKENMSRYERGQKNDYSWDNRDIL